jgi:hypothetical protein
MYSGHVGHQSIGHIIVTIMLLLEATRYNMSLIALKRTIRVCFDNVNPFGSDHNDVRWEGN